MNYEKTEVILHNIEDVHFGNMYPGYPFAMIGYYYTKLNSGEIDGSTFHNLEEFRKVFETNLIFQCLGSNLAIKGSWATGEHKMESYKAFLDANEDDFYFGELNAVKLYFAFYSAYREYKDKDSIIFFVINTECDYLDVQVFQSEEELQKYCEEYWKPYEDEE